jgi:hypothetical protein
MKRIAVIMLALCSTGLAATPPKKKPATKPAPAALTIPADATRIDEHTYVHTDAQGKTWTYRKTPFGLQKSERTAETPAPYALPETVRDRQSPFSAEGSAAAPRASDASEEVTFTESGENITFKRKTPFGNNTWTKKKSELTAEERALLERAKAR